MKKCFKCAVTKPLVEFYKHKKTKDGYLGKCMACTKKDVADRRYGPNREAVLESQRIRSKKFYAENSEKLLIANREYYASNPDAAARKRAYSRAYAKAHRAAKNAETIRYRARKRNAAGSATTEQIAARVAYYGGLCWVCGATWREIDHVIPLTKGGSNWPGNLRPICRSCNASKGNKWPF